MLCGQACERAVGDVGRPLAVSGVDAMGAMVYAMTAEWEQQAHAAALARAAIPAPVPPPRVPDGTPPAAQPPGSAAAAGAEAIAGATAAAGLAESGAGEAAAGARSDKAAAVGIGEVIDLVPGLNKKQ